MQLSGVFDQPWERRWPNRRSGPFTISMQVGILDGRPQIIRLEVRGFDAEDDRRRPASPTRVEAITSTAIRLPLRQLLDEYLAETRRAIRKADKNPFGSPWKASGMQEARRAVMTAKRSGRRPAYGDDHYRQVARVYSQALRDGRFPTDAVKEAFTVHKTTAAKWVSRARELGYLPKTTKGRSRGEMPSGSGKRGAAEMTAEDLIRQWKGEP